MIASCSSSQKNVHMRVNSVGVGLIDSVEMHGHDIRTRTRRIDSIKKTKTLQRQYIRKGVKTLLRMVWYLQRCGAAQRWVLPRRNDNV